MNHNQTIIRAGWDPGFAGNKFAHIQHGEMVTYALPSAVGEANRGNKDGLSLAGVVRGRNGRRPFNVTFDGYAFLVGPNVARYTEPIDRMDFNRFTDSPELRATFYAGLYRLINGGAHQVALAIALPVEVVQDKAEATRVEYGLRGWLLGQHSFSVDGVETVVTVETVRAKVPQPVATWFDWGLDTSGQWVKGKAAQLAPSLIIDQGFNTLDVLVVEGGRISERISEGDTLGMRRAAERLIRTLKTKYGVELELRPAAELVRQAVNGQPVETYVNGQLTEISAEVKRALQSLEADECHFSRQRRLVEQQPLTAPTDCCLNARWSHLRRRILPDGGFLCEHWVPGRLETLHIHGLARVQLSNPTSRKPTIQLWRMLPPLTPHQVKTYLTPALQTAYARFISEYGHLFRLDMERWQRITVPSLLSLLPEWTVENDNFEQRQARRTFLAEAVQNPDYLTCMSDNSGPAPI